MKISFFYIICMTNYLTINTKKHIYTNKKNLFLQKLVTSMPQTKGLANKKLFFPLKISKYITEEEKDLINILTLKKRTRPC